MKRFKLGKWGTFTRRVGKNGMIKFKRVFLFKRVWTPLVNVIVREDEVE